MRFTFERLLTEVLPPKQEDWAKVCFGRRASVAHPAPFRVERPFDSQLSGEDELQLLTGSTSWDS